jgi:hypothetical protein
MGQAAGAGEGLRGRGGAGRRAARTRTRREPQARGAARQSQGVRPQQAVSRGGRGRAGRERDRRTGVRAPSSTRTRSRRSSRSGRPRTDGAIPAGGVRRELPVFVAGMPRSGTSLIDQIIDAHPRAAGVGELASIEAFAARSAARTTRRRSRPAASATSARPSGPASPTTTSRNVKKLAPAGTERVVNKALGNNKLVGLLSRLFPRRRGSSTRCATPATSRSPATWGVQQPHARVDDADRVGAPAPGSSPGA